MIKNKKERKLYKIGHLTDLLGVTPRTIRYYEQFGLLPHVKRSEGNVRLFDDEDIELLKKIRFFQKEQYLPLDVIREKLYGNQEDDVVQETGIVTDFLTQLTTEQHDLYDVNFVSSAWKSSENAEILNPNQPQNMHPFTHQQFEEKYIELYKQGKKVIYSIHTDPQFSNAFEAASKAAVRVSDKVKVKCIATNSIGTGTGLFLLQLSKVLQNDPSEEKIDLFISKTKPLIYSFFVFNGLGSFITANEGGNAFHESIKKDLSKLKPFLVYESKIGQLTLADVYLKQEHLSEAMITHLETEIITRGKYLNYIMISYHYYYAEALQIANEIRKLYPNTPIFVEPDERILPKIIGEECIGISIV